MPVLPLDNWGWNFTEPNPYNPPGNLRVGEAPTLEVNLNGTGFPGPRLHADNGVTWVPAGLRQSVFSTAGRRRRVARTSPAR